MVPDEESHYGSRLINAECRNQCRSITDRTVAEKHEQVHRKRDKVERQQNGQRQQIQRRTDTEKRQRAKTQIHGLTETD